MKQLLTIYNNLADSPVKKFKNRASGNERVIVLLSLTTKKKLLKAIGKTDLTGTESDNLMAAVFPGQKTKGPGLSKGNISNAKPPVTETPASEPGSTDKSGPVIKTTPKGRKVLGVVRQSLCSSYDVSLNEITIMLSGKTNVVAPVIDRLLKARLLDIEEIDSKGQNHTYVLSRKGRKYIKENYGSIQSEPEQDFTVGEFIASGPKSEYVGKRIHKLITINPRKPGTSGHAGFELVEDGMTFEDYRKKGGLTRDLKWNIEKGWLEVRDEAK